MGSRIVVQLCFLAVTLLATRLLSIAEFGVYSLASSLIILSRSLFYAGPYEYMLKATGEGTAKYACFAANLILALTASALLALFAAVSPALFGGRGVADVLLALIPALALSSVAAWFEARLLRRDRVERYYVFLIVAELVASAAAVVLLLQGFGILSLVAQLYVRIAILLTLFAVTVRERPLGAFALDEAWRVLVWSWSRYLSVVLNFSSNYAPDFILATLWSPAATGLYRAGARVVTAASDLFAQPLQKIVQTNVSARVARGQPADDAWLGMFAAVAFVGWSLLAGLALLADQIAPLVLGKQWAAAGPVIAIFCVVRAFSLLDATTTPLLIAYDRHRVMLAVQVAAAALVAIAAFGMASRGVTAVALSVGAVLIATSLTWLVLALRLSQARAASLTRAATTVLLPVAGVVACVLLLRWLDPAAAKAPPLSMILPIAAGALGGLVGLLIVRRGVADAFARLGRGAG